MNKQQQIEKMAVIGCVRNPQAKTAEECGKCDFRQGMCNAYRHAENLYNAGYRKTFTSDLASDTQKAFKEGYEKAKEEQTMIYLKFPPIEKIQGFKIYGNKYLKLWKNTVTKDDYIAVLLCGERVCFPATQDGVDKAEKWVNEKRAEIANALKL